jgi:hypothetical protein
MMIQHPEPGPPFNDLLGTTVDARFGVLFSSCQRCKQHALQIQSPPLPLNRLSF